MTEHLPTLLLLVAAAALALAPVRDTPASDPQQLSFDVRGVRGPIRGVVVLEGERIVEVRVSSSGEGADGKALSGPAAVAGYAGRPARPPVRVDAVSGATLSSRRLQDAVNKRLAARLHALSNEADAP